MLIRVCDACGKTIDGPSAFIEILSESLMPRVPKRRYDLCEQCASVLLVSIADDYDVSDFSSVKTEDERKSK